MGAAVFSILAALAFCASCQTERSLDAELVFEQDNLGPSFSMDVCDMDSDGCPDLVISSGDKVKILYQRDGRYSPSACKEIPVAGARSCKAGDFDNDGIADVAVVGSRQSLHLFLGGESLSKDHASMNDNQFFTCLSAGRIGKSGFDFLVGPVWRNWNGKSFTFGYFSGPKSNDNAFSLIADMDCDGVGDAVFVSGKGDFLRICYGPFLGPFQGRAIQPCDACEFVQFAPSASPIAQIAVGDVNGDGRPDVVAALGNGDIALYLQNQPIGFASGAEPSKTIKGSGESSLIEVADLDGDGLCDLVVIERKSGAAHILFQREGGLPDGVFAAGRTLAFMNGAFCVKAADLDGDGKREILVGGANGTLKVFKIKVD